MAPATSSPAAAQKLFPFKGSVRRTEAPRRPSLPARKYKSMAEIMATAKYVVIERADYSDVRCVQCGSGEHDDELLLCDKCDRGFHMSCLRPIVVRIPIGTWLCPSCSGQRRGRSLSQTKIIDFFGIQKRSDGIGKFASTQASAKETWVEDVLNHSEGGVWALCFSSQLNERWLLWSASYRVCKEGGCVGAWMIGCFGQNLRMENLLSNPFIRVWNLRHKAFSQ